MRVDGRRSTAVTLLAFVGSLLVLPGTALGRVAGIASSGFGPLGCNQCHNGGSTPAVALEGPTEVLPGSTNEYTLTIVETGSQNRGGLNVSTGEGTLSLGGTFLDNTRIIVGLAGRDEITHTGPKAANELGLVEFSFLWTAPDAPASVVMVAWGNAVNGNTAPAGDQADSASLDILATDGEFTPTPIGDATPTPTPAVCATELVPPDPALVSDADQRKCQDAIGKAGLAYVSGALKAMQGCLLKFQKGKLSGDPTELCVGAWDIPPTDGKTAAKVAKAEAKARKFLTKKCTDDFLAGLDSCSVTLDGLETCLITERASLVRWAITDQFGTLFPAGNKGEQKCQKVIASESRKFLSANLKAIQKCLSARNKSGSTSDAATLCLGSVAEGAFVSPTDTKAAAAISKAEGKLRSKVGASCTDGQVAALDPCGNDVSSLGECLVCTNRALAYDATRGAYGDAAAAQP